MDIKAAILGANMAISELTANGQIGDIERKAIVCFPETEFALSGGEYLGIPGTPFENGDTVTATYDGVEYERKAAVFPYENFARGYYVGNLSVLGGEDTGEPFAILSTYGDEDNEFLGFIVLDVNEFGSERDSTHRVGCSTITDTVKPIDPKYLAKEIDATKFNVEYGEQSMTLNDLILTMATTSAMNNGALQEEVIPVAGLREAFSATGQTVLTMTIPGEYTAYFPMTLSFGGKRVVNASCVAMGNFGGPAAFYVLIVFSGNSDDVAIYNKTVVFTT